MFKELSNKEEIQLQLQIVHENTEQEEVKYLASMRDNVKHKWSKTLMFIDQLKEIREDGGRIIL